MKPGNASFLSAASLRCIFPFPYRHHHSQLSAPVAAKATILCRSSVVAIIWGAPGPSLLGTGEMMAPLPQPQSVLRRSSGATHAQKSILPSADFQQLSVHIWRRMR
jgi:hypothetical protein